MTDFNLTLSQIRQRLEILYQIVDELEAQGGGGQGGTDDYTNLSNKPMINDIILVGNKSLADLGIASATALSDKADRETTYTKTEVDTALAAKANTATTYTKTETNSAITNSINALDKTSVGGSTQYLTTISQTNGLINATAATPDATPTANSDKLVKSKGIKTYVDNAQAAANVYTDTQVATKASVNDIYGTGTAIASGTDLNNLTTAGLYTCQTITIANTLSNTPITGSAFRLEVKYLNNNTRIRQECYILSDTSMYYARTYTSTGWKPWYAFTGTQVVPPESQQNLTSLRSAELTVEPNGEVDA